MIGCHRLINFLEKCCRAANDVFLAPKAERPSSAKLWNTIGPAAHNHYLEQ